MSDKLKDLRIKNEKNVFNLTYTKENEDQEMEIIKMKIKAVKKEHMELKSIPLHRMSYIKWIIFCNL